MSEIIYALVLAVISAFVAIGFIKLSELFWRSIKNAQSKIIIIPIGGHVDDIEVFIRSLINRTNKSNKFNEIENIIIADMGADKETLDICNKLQKQYNFIYLCEGREISEKLKEKLYIWLRKGDFCYIINITNFMWGRNVRNYWKWNNKRYSW